MGNQHSSVSSAHDADNASTRSVVRKPPRILRKSSTNLFKRNDSKSPLPRELTTAVIQVHQQVSPTTLDDSNVENDHSPIDPFMDSNQPSHSPEVVQIHSASTLTITDENAVRPLSASTTIRDATNDSRRESRMEMHTKTSFVEEFTPERELQSKQVSQLPSKRDSALSPSIPAPSPLPEESPHKYGLKDRMETPEVPEPEEINIVKARRRSSGLDIFNVSTKYSVDTIPLTADSITRKLSLYNPLPPSLMAYLLLVDELNQHNAQQRRVAGHMLHTIPHDPHLHTCPPVLRLDLPQQCPRTPTQVNVAEATPLNLLASPTPGRSH